MVSSARRTQPPGAVDEAEVHQTLSFDAYLKCIEDRFLSGQRLD
jgi:hypothetical protein